jgi:hypothetical protein
MCMGRGDRRRLDRTDARASAISARWSGHALLVCNYFLTVALTSGRRFFSRRRDKAIVKSQSVQVLYSLVSPSQRLLLSLLKKRGALSVQLLDALDR